VQGLSQGVADLAGEPTGELLMNADKAWNLALELSMPVISRAIAPIRTIRYETRMNTIKRITLIYQSLYLSLFGLLKHLFRRI
jgi:hypothetical protein